MAISFDSVTDGGDNGGGTSPLAFNHTVGAGANPLILACYNGDNFGSADDITARTFNSVAMALFEKITVATGGDRMSYIDGLAGAASGTHQVSITAASSHLLQGGAASYLGVKQSTPLDNHTTNASTPGAVSLTTSITPVASGCWAVLLEGCYTGGSASPPGAGTGATRRIFDGVNGGWGIFDSNGPLTAGVPYSMTTTRDSHPFDLAIVHVVITIAPAVAGGGVVYAPHRAMLPLLVQ
jgi:hypothetical protein